MVHPAGVEPAAYGIGIRHSIQLSYECKMWWEWAKAIYDTVLFQHINFLQLKPPRFLCLKYRIDLSRLHERQFIPAGCKGRTPGVTARAPSRTSVSRGGSHSIASEFFIDFFYGPHQFLRCLNARFRFKKCCRNIFY